MGQNLAFCVLKKRQELLFEKYGQDPSEGSIDDGNFFFFLIFYIKLPVGSF